MKSLLRIALIAAAFALVAAVPLHADTTPVGRYICPPCSQPCDTMVFTHPGTCPACGMTLVLEADSGPPHDTRRKVAILLFPGVEIIDSMGPYEVFGAAGYDVYSVGASRDPVTSAMGQLFTPKYTFDDAPQPDVLVVPGGGVGNALHSDRTLEWIRAVTGKDGQTMSVCNGAFILASAGLLDGLTATTTAHNIPKLAEQYPKVHVVSDQRYVDNGHIVTTAGLSAGIDGALHVVARLDGEGFAEEVALAEEYPWTPKGGFARAAMADQLIPEIGFDSLGTWKMESTRGATDRWEIVAHGTSPLRAEEILRRVNRAFTEKARWREARTRAAASAGRFEDHWKFAGWKGEPWNASMTITPVRGEKSAYTVKVAIARVE